MKGQTMRLMLMSMTIMLGVLACPHRLPAATTTTTPHMSLILPVPNSAPGPQWAQEIVNAFQAVDSHTHVPGSGMPITSAAFEINADFEMNYYNIVGTRSLQLLNNSSLLSKVTDKTNLYVTNGNLYYNNSSGIAVQITSGNAVNVSGVGNISGMGGTTASVTYSDTLKNFLFTQSSGVTANIAAGSYSLYTNTAGANPIVIQAPTGVSSYNLTLPASAPPATKLVSMDQNGNLAAAIDGDSGTIRIAGDFIQVIPGSIDQTMMAARPVMAPTGGTGAIAENINGLSGIFTTSSASPALIPGTTVYLTTLGRPVVVKLQGASGNVGSYFQIVNSISGVNFASMLVQIRNETTGTYICSNTYNATVVTGGAAVSQGWPVNLECLDPEPAGSYIYNVYISAIGYTNYGVTTPTYPVSAQSAYINVFAYEL